MRLAALASILLVCLCAPCAAQQSGMGLLSDCSDPKEKPVEGLACQVYFVGFMDGFLISGGLNQSGICLPPATTANQVRLIAEKYMRDHPEQLQLPAALIITRALGASFPCKNSN
jgi:hypothetical protein